MSFITKRERVFNEHGSFELPARNEGKLKAYASCTDSRAWSHYGSDKSEHLVEIIKRNNDLCRPKYVPTDVIVNTLMGGKNTEISWLKRKINEFEQLLAVYDQLDLTPEQKDLISNAHEEIRLANKGLDELSLDLDLTGFTEGMDSEDYQTGKSGGDMTSEISRVSEWPNNLDIISEQKDCRKKCTCDISTNATDPRIDEMHDIIIYKDAKLNAMKNTISVLEIDVRQPYCLYAHIYTALEKIFGVLCQNAEYKNYLYLLSTNQAQSEGSDIKRKILEKLKLLETFSIALIIPSSKNSKQSTTEFVTKSTRIETAYALRLADIKKPYDNLEDQRAHLISDIMNNKDIKVKTSEELNRIENDQTSLQVSLSKENLKRLKNLQSDYNELMLCYENLKKERDELLTKCTTYTDLEDEIERLQAIVNDYNNVCNEKEYFKMRSEQLNTLKEQFIVLSEETSNIESKLRAESEINSIKSFKINEYANENLILVRRMSDIKIAFEKEKNLLECKLKEAECKIMCQEQQIKNMSQQIDSILAQINEYEKASADHLSLLNEFNTLKHEKHETECELFYSEKEKQHLQEQLEEKVEIIDNLKNDIDQINGDYKNNIERINYLEKYVDELKEEINMRVQLNENLARNIDDKNNDIISLKDTIKNNSLEFQQLLEQRALNEASKNDEQVKEMERDNNIEVEKRVSDASTNANYSEEIIILIEDNKRLHGLIEKYKLNENKLQQQIHQLHIDNEDMNNIINKAEYDLKSQLNSKDQYSTELQNALFKAISDRDKIMKLLEKSNINISDLELEKLELEKEIKNNSNNLSKEQSNYLIQHKEEIIKLKEKYEKHIGKLQIIEKDLLNNNNELSDQNKDICNKISKINYNYEQLNIAYNDVLNKNKILKDEINNIYKSNTELFIKLKGLEQQQIIYNETENENVSIKATLSSLTEKNKVMKDKLNSFEELEEQYKRLFLNNEEIVKEKINLEKERDNLKSHLEALKIENNNLEQKQKDLILIQSSPSDRLTLISLYEEVESMKTEMVTKQAKIQELHDTNNEYDELIKNYVETIAVKDEKISILENHINELEEEIKQLHENFSSLLETSEEIKEISIRNLSKSLKNIESQHSQATIDFKLEIEELRKNNAMLTNQVSLLTEKTKETKDDRDRLISKSTEMENEKNILLQQLQHLEIESAGFSDLVPESGNSEDILKSFTRIKESMQVGYSKTSILEQKLLSVQTSSQLLQSKADEAKKIVEKEKLKIILEKEDAIQDKLKLENQLKKLKESYEIKIADDNQKIKDLNAELMNKKLITDNINKSHKNTIIQLNEELDKLHKLYQNALDDSIDLKEKIINLDNENNKNKELVVTTNIVLKQKLEEITHLRDTLNTLHSKDNRKLQSHNKVYMHEVGIQTEKSGFKFSCSINSDLIPENIKGIKKNNPVNLKEINELNTKTESTNDLDSNINQKVKLNRLTLTPLNHLSLTNKNTVMNMSKSSGTHAPTNISNIHIVSATDNNVKPKDKVLLGKSKDDLNNKYKLKTYEKKITNKIKTEAKPKELENRYKSSNKVYSYYKKSPNITLSRSTSSHEVIFHKRDIIVNRSFMNKYSDTSFSKRSLSLSDISDSYTNNKDNYESKNKNRSNENNIIEFDNVENDLIPSSSLLDITNTEDNFIRIENIDNKEKYITKNSYSDFNILRNNEKESMNTSNSKNFSEYNLHSNWNKKIFVDKSVLAILDNKTLTKEYEEKILSLHNSLNILENEYKDKVKAIKTQYDNNIKNIKSEHSHGVHSLQNLHEERLQYTIKTYDNEVENLRTLSLTAIRKADKYNKEKEHLAIKLKELEKELIKSSNGENKTADRKSNIDLKKLTKTSVRSINLLEKINTSPCTCSVDINLSDTIRNIFEQVDARQRKTAERNYINFIVNKITSDNIQTLDTRELAFLHLKVCRTWKKKLLNEEENKKKLEFTTDLKQENSPNSFVSGTDGFVDGLKGRIISNTSLAKNCNDEFNTLQSKPSRPLPAIQIDFANKNACNCTLQTILKGKSSVTDISLSGTRPRRKIPDANNRAILVKLQPDQCVESNKYHNEVPIKLENTSERISIKKSSKKLEKKCSYNFY